MDVTGTPMPDENDRGHFIRVNGQLVVTLSFVGV
jgi:hypothetical protein